MSFNNSRHQSFFLFIFLFLQPLSTAEDNWTQSVAGCRILINFTQTDKVPEEHEELNNNPDKPAGGEVDGWRPTETACATVVPAVHHHVKLFIPQ